MSLGKNDFEGQPPQRREAGPVIADWGKIYAGIRKVFPATSYSLDELMELTQSGNYAFSIDSAGEIGCKSAEEPPAELYLTYTLLMFLGGSISADRTVRFHSEAQDLECEVTRKSIKIGSYSKLDDEGPVEIPWG